DAGEGWRMVYLMLLDNNGKNRAQLEHAGIDLLFLCYLQERLWENADENDGWPKDTAQSVHVLWAMWMLTTPAKLQAETRGDRDLVVRKILPFVLNPYRYHQAEAPPSHFHLPFPSGQNSTFLPVSFPSAHGPYPIYVEHQETAHPYFGSISLLSPPPITTAAKLLYFAHREIIPFNIPPHLPRTRAEAQPSTTPSPTQEDFIEINSHRGAEFQPCITWDWDQGHRLVNGVPDTSNYDHSVRWDPDYWRRRLCGDAWQVEPKWRPGKVYVPGSMDGLWQGRLVFPSEDSMRRLMQHAAYPSDQNFNETALTLTHQPLFMRLKENHALGSTSPSHHAPLPPRIQHRNDDLSEWADLSMRNAWFPGALGNLSVYSLRDPPPNSRIYAPPGQRKRVLVSLEDRIPLPGVEYQHEGFEDCEWEREKAMRKGMETDEEDHDVIMNAYSKDWRIIDQLFEGVGLGRDETRPEPPDEDTMDVKGDEAEAGVLEFIQDKNADFDFYDTRPVRRATDRAKITECDGIQDIVFSGTTDRRHALAWNNFTFYGRVRPWDGLIGILRRSYWPRQNFIFLYGYLVGSETFVGNWRFAAKDPNVPSWESAFVMSRRKDSEEEEDM
ncbi:hypothetical protein AN958_12262, partial [Leucoagaricus sp. SymC.cos]